ncbi:MAG: protein-tyrosine-phosphatase [Flavobacteriales bacterium]|nr:protein-tyrosine-phosphatase [Flavobacteriales bacterium]
MNSSIKAHCESLIQNFNEIPVERKLILEKIADFIQKKKDKNEKIQLIYVCTHNSRRSHFGQVWGKVAAEFYGISNVETFSGGTEATAFNPNAINALKKVNFIISSKNSDAKNPIYEVVYDENKEPIICFSKKYSDKANPEDNFVAIMTCSDADENCPFIPNCELRIATTYEDPKKFDNTELQDEKYLERCNQIATECLYMFSKVK